MCFGLNFVPKHDSAWYRELFFTGVPDWISASLNHRQPRQTAANHGKPWQTAANHGKLRQTTANAIVRPLRTIIAAVGDGGTANRKGVGQRYQEIPTMFLMYLVSMADGPRYGWIPFDPKL